MTIKISAARFDTLRAKYIGLMFSKCLSPIYFTTYFGVHTFFVKEPIVVIVLKDNGVVQIVKNLVPWRFFIWNLPYNRVLELPSSDARAGSIRAGDRVKIIELSDHL